MKTHQDSSVAAYIADAVRARPYVYTGKTGLACGRSNPRARSRLGHSASAAACNPYDPREVIPGEFPPVFGQPIIDPTPMFDVEVDESEYTYNVKAQGGVRKSHAALVAAMVERAKETGVMPTYMPLQQFGRDGYWVRKPGALYVDTTGNEKVVGPAKIGGVKVARQGVADVTYASISRSCPSTCKLRDKGCYAQHGHVADTVTRLDLEAKSFNLNAVEVAKAEAFGIDNSHLDVQGRPTVIEDTRVLRLHVSGDASTVRAATILSDAVARWYTRSRSDLATSGYMPAANNPRRCWSYTHAWRSVPRQVWSSVSILASIDKPSEAKQALARGYAPALVVASFEGNSTPILVGGVKFLKCPAQTQKNAACVKCMLCFRSEWLHSMGYGIAFEAHGAGGSAVRQRLEGTEAGTGKGKRHI